MTDHLASIEQRSEEWVQARLGKVTASRIADATARTRTGWGASRANYMAELLAERLTGTPRDTIANGAMQWGTDMEPEARAAYSFMNDVMVEEIGFVLHPTIGGSGASPDGFVGDEGLVEIKCPNTATHIDTLLGANIDVRYMKQMQWQMACAGRTWCDFVSFDPRLPERMQMHCRRIPRDPSMIAELERDILEFLNELRGKQDALLEQYGEPEDLPDAVRLLAAG
ncbi:exonuclease [Zhengella mangrovi]|uniref:Exonuclease n=1 Tax=Zhengella mangrovi TaxID=1982044 RepID=A0A2G1QM25_9HYPH|nr:lambda exonuclease family protein [Zhengella mangrovi]PHP66524.1 exonuclease [Zhengella mangrovi]